MREEERGRGWTKKKGYGRREERRTREIGEGIKADGEGGGGEVSVVVIQTCCVCVAAEQSNIRKLHMHV